MASVAKLTLSFAALEARIQAMPDGPANVLSTPKWLSWFIGVAALGIIVGIAPFLLIQFVEPKAWMVGMARLGVWMAAAGAAPYLARSAGVIALEFWHWRRKLVEQSDHDVAQFRDLRVWLGGFPRAEIIDLHRFAQRSHQRMAAKLGLLQGGFDKLGVLPALLALVWFFRSAGDDLSIQTLLDTPWWQSWLTAMFVIIYLICLLAVRMRLRLQLYEAVLSDALEHHVATNMSEVNETAPVR